MALHVQNQIRNNAEEVNGFFQDMVKWEKDIKTKDKNIIKKKLTKRTHPVAPTTRQGAGTVAVSTTSATKKSASAASHTYDVGYDKWEKMKISESDDVEEIYTQTTKAESTSKTLLPESTTLTPASLAITPLSDAQVKVPKALGEASTVDIEAFERERGNAEFKAGNFANAIKCYTKCLGLKPKNYVAFSNRAMAYLKQKEHHKAETDCSCALRISPSHVKSLLRRATARSLLGKHRAAIQDLTCARQFDPTNKQVHQELKKAQDALKACTTKAPADSLNTMWEGDYQQAILAEEMTRQQEAQDESQHDQQDRQAQTHASLVSGPEMPLPGSNFSKNSIRENESDSTDSQRSSGDEEQNCVPQNGPPPRIDMTRIAEQVEAELALEQEQEQGQPISNGVSFVREKGNEVDAGGEDSEWVVLRSADEQKQDPSGCTRMHIEEQSDDADDCGDEASTRKNRNDDDLDKEICTVRGIDRGTEKKKVKTSSSSAKKSKEKDKKKVKKAKSSSSSAAMYSIERSLLMCKGNDQLLMEFLESIDEKKFLSPSKGKEPAGQTLEVDVVVDLVLAAARCFGELEGNWSRVLLWLEGVAQRSGAAVFGFVAAMMSEQQKQAVNAVLERARLGSGDDGAVVDRIEGISRTYQLI